MVIGDVTPPNSNIDNSTANKEVTGTNNNDTIKNSGSVVKIYALDGDDSINNSAEIVTIYGGTGKDTVYNNSDNVSIYGGEGNDSLYNSHGDNVLIFGDEGADILKNYYGKSVTISGGDGNDDVYIDAHQNSISGGAGNDNIEIGYPYDNNTISGDSGDDIISFSNDTKNNVVQYTYGDGNDTIFGFNSDDTLQITTPKDFETSTGSNGLYILFDNGSITLKDVTSANVVTIAGGGYSTSTTPTTPSGVGYPPTNPTVQSGGGGGDTIIVNGPGFFGPVTINNNYITSVNNTYTYNGGNKYISNYVSNEIVDITNINYTGIDLEGNTFYVNSADGGRLGIENARNKFIRYSGSNNFTDYSYVASGGGVINGAGRIGREIMIGAENSDNQIYAGNGGSSMWGGMGGTDTLTGGDGYDEFFYAMGSGSDVIQNSADNDVVNLLGVSLSQITYANVTQSEISIGFNDGGNLKLQGQADTGFMLEGMTFAADRSTGGWRVK